jgi:hypothetical protein
MSKVVVGLSVSLDGFITGRRTFDVAQQYLRAGLLDEIHLNLLGDQKFDLECTRVVESDGVTHLSYRVVR